mmetsp:Transcript_19958/g.29683  ORF Transcript_19958/g.29683 Transcript_19958/m.29683 type:complete len:221 (-) Transcript_19958:8-670(-)
MSKPDNLVEKSSKESISKETAKPNEADSSESDADFIPSSDSSQDDEQDNGESEQERKARLEAEAKEKQRKQEQTGDYLWALLNDPNRSVQSFDALATTPTQPIRTKKTQTVKKTTTTTTTTSTTRKRPRAVKRSRLSEIVARISSKKPKTTFAKSKQDWRDFTDKAGIQDELKHNASKGYLAKQEFLKSAELKKHDEYLRNKKTFKAIEKKNNSCISLYC